MERGIRTSPPHLGDAGKYWAAVWSQLGGCLEPRYGCPLTATGWIGPTKMDKWGTQGAADAEAGWISKPPWGGGHGRLNRCESVNVRLQVEVQLGRIET
jgi:hypothetical protein